MDRNQGSGPAGTGRVTAAPGDDWFRDDEVAMTRCMLLDGTLHRPRYGGAVIGAALALVLFLLSGQVGAGLVPDDLDLMEEDRACLECHAKPGLRKTFDDGQTRSMYVSPRAYAASMHGGEGCESCHYEIDFDDHGEPQPAGSSAVVRTAEAVDTCRDCHKKAVRQYEDSVHLALIRQGSDQAPLCADCHNPHTTLSVEDSIAAGDDLCGNCHEQIADAYASSVHGQPGDDRLACRDCHRAHDVKAALVGEHLKDQCVSCHEDVALTHADWLPNSERHLEAVSCSSCHSPGTSRQVNLRLYEGGVQHQVSDKLGVPQFVKADATSDPETSGLDGLALWSLLQDFNRNGGEVRTRIRGRLEVQTGVESHSLAGRDQALSDCAACHRKGAASFQRVTVSVVGPDGRPLRHATSEGLLTSVESLASVGGFYMIGSTRIKWLDYLLVLALSAGLVIPAGHLTVKVATSRLRAAAAAQPPSSSPDRADRNPPR
jgi:predicted CXXCH cytochrome family protein